MRKMLVKIFLLQACGVLLLTTPAAAHELIPKALQQYLQTHPAATAEDIRNFVQEAAPEYATRVENEAAILKIKNQKTSTLDTIIDFLNLGVHHILSGADHVLFVLALLLTVHGIGHILKLTTTFTIAHTSTLVLAGLGIITLSPRITEPLIALSIGVVACTSVFLKKTSRLSRWSGEKIPIVFLFGLFHGLGFAGLLKEIGIPEHRLLASLFSFNIGIEFGQLFIVGVALPILLYIRRYHWYNRCIYTTAAVMSVASITWFVARIIG